MANELKIEMKINRYINHIGKDDLILDNGACVQVTTQRGAWGTWDYTILQMSKKLFKDLKKRGLIFVDEKETEKKNKPYENPWLTYYRFDIDRMIENGYKVVSDDGE